MKYCVIAPDVKLGKNVKVFSFVNLYGCEIGDNTKIGLSLKCRRKLLSVAIARFRPIHLFAKESILKTMYLLDTM